MAKVVLETTDNRYISGTPNWLVVALLGLLIGVGVWGFSWVTERFIIDPILCRDMTLQACGNVTSVAGNIAAIIGACVGLGHFIRTYIMHKITNCHQDALLCRTTRHPLPPLPHQQLRQVVYERVPKPCQHIPLSPVLQVAD